MPLPVPPCRLPLAVALLWATMAPPHCVTSAGSTRSSRIDHHSVTPPAAGLRGSLAGPGMLPGHGKAGPSRELDHLECRKCGEDLFDFSRSGGMMDSPKKPLGVLRPARLGATGLLSGAGGGHSAAPAPLVGGEEIALESGVTTGPSDPSEPGFAGPHKEPTHQTILGRKMQVHHLKNPHGREFEVVTVTNLTSYKTHGAKVAEHSWFPGYSWQIIVCAHCGHHIGWRFERLNSPTPSPTAAEQKSTEDQPAEFFFGILPSEALIESTALRNKLVTHGDL